jgi:hypothetical protein
VPAVRSTCPRYSRFSSVFLIMLTREFNTRKLYVASVSGGLSVNKKRYGTNRALRLNKYYVVGTCNGGVCRLPDISLWQH